jgi:hypothetical protein
VGADAAKEATDQPPVAPSRLPFRQPITLSDVPVAVYGVDAEGAIDADTWRKTIVEPDTGSAIFYVRFAPNQSTGAHWHPSDTAYIVVKGTMIVDGEGEYRAGQVRLVEGGYAYGSEGAGSDGCEFIFVSLGPFDRYDPDERPPPRGRWDTASGRSGS